MKNEIRIVNGVYEFERNGVYEIVGFFQLQLTSSLSNIQCAGI